VPIVQDDDQNSTDLMKCIRSLEEKEKADGADVGVFVRRELVCSFRVGSLRNVTLALQTLYDIIFLGGLSGRLDQTVHTLSCLHKLRKSGRRIVAVTDDNVGWVLDEAGSPFFSSNPESTHALRVNTISLSITRYWGQLAGCSPSEWIPPC
jgi:thiamine pyrophosphokinase